MVEPISYSLEVMYTLSTTMPQTDEGYNMLPTPALSVFRVILFSFGETFQVPPTFLFSGGQGRGLSFQSNLTKKYKFPATLQHLKMVN